MSADVATIAHEWLDWAREQFHQAQAHLAIDVPGVKPTLPPKSFFRFPPLDFPTTLPPPVDGPNFEHPFTIPSEWYNAALSPVVPITFALVYITAITYLNSVNRRRQKKPWAISQTAIFKLFVLTHNIFLSLYSLWTFVGMYNALRVSIANPREHGIVGTIDSLCKIHGPRGYGSAATFNERTNTWGFTDRAFRLAKDGLAPDSTDVGRIWNEGLAFYGWIFYLSKFYEVIDTLIIIAKGKTSSFLQTYHHAGAMLCMWAGIRYMSPPIWLFVFENSFIHFIMYAFYTSTTLGIRVPKPLKQILTTMQITQFVSGATYAFAHYFVAYQIPVSIPYIFHLGEAAQEVVSNIKSDASSVLSTATATASADLASWLKKLALRAAGREGLAENVENELGQTFGIDAVHAVQDLIRREETRYRNEVEWVNCLDTSGQTFAIYLNIFYLAPLTWLFLRFFIKSYIQRSDKERRSSVGQKAYIAGKSMDDARRGVSRRLSEAFEDYQGANGEMKPDDVLAVGKQAGKELKDLAKKATAEVADAAQGAREKILDATETVSDKLKNINTQSMTDDAQETFQKISNVSMDDVQRIFEEMKDEARDKIQEAKEAIQDPVLSGDTHEESEVKPPGTPQSAKKSVENLLSEETTGNAADTAEKVKEEADEISDKAVAKIEEVGDGEEKDGEQDTKAEIEKSGEEVSIEQENDTTRNNQLENAETQYKSTAEDQDNHDNNSIHPRTTDQPDGDTSEPSSAAVQEGKSFADAVIEGVAEQDQGETEVGNQKEAGSPGEDGEEGA